MKTVERSFIFKREMVEYIADYYLQKIQRRLSCWKKCLIKSILHTAIDKIQNEKDLRLFCLTLGETIFEYFREVVIPKEF